MKVKRNSWHYKVWAYKRTNYNGDIPANLCSYFWTVLFKVFVGIPFMILCPIAGIGLDGDNETEVKRPWLFGLFLFGIWLSSAFSYLLLGIPELTAFTCIATWVIGGTLGFIFVTEYIKQSANNYGSFTSVVFETLAVKKKKICPIIEVVD